MSPIVGAPPIKPKATFFIIFVIIVAAVTAVGCLCVKRQRFLEYKNSKTPLPAGFTYTAHTGCMDTDDNSLESIEKGAEYGADIVEFDLNFTADNTPVLCHDEPKGGEVTLEEAFKKLAEYGTLRANVDVKNTANLSAVQELSEKYGLSDRIFYTGIELEDVETVKKDSPKIRYFLNVSVDKSQNTNVDYIASLVKTVSECGAVGINFNKDNATKEIVNAFHRANLLVSVWTADSEYDIYRFLSLAPDNITTRQPDKTEEILENRKNTER